MPKPWLNHAKADTKTPKPSPNKHKGRFQEINAFAQATQRKLSRSELGVWLVLWTRTDAKTGLAKVSLNTMARETGCSQRMAQYAVKSLIKKGLLERVSKGSNLTNTPSVYRTHATMKDEG
jgi:hypothetical protein